MRIRFLQVAFLLLLAACVPGAFTAAPPSPSPNTTSNPVSETTPSGDLLDPKIIARAYLDAWKSEDYTMTPMSWSPDGKYLVLRGYVVGVQREALFVIPAP